MRRVLANVKEKQKVLMQTVQKSEEKFQKTRKDCTAARKAKRAATKEKSRQAELASNHLDKVRNIQEVIKTERAQTAAFWAEQVSMLEPKDVGTKSRGGNGRTATVEFERHVRACMSNGASAPAMRKQIMMDARFFLQRVPVENGLYTRRKLVSGSAGSRGVRILAVRYDRCCRC